MAGSLASLLADHLPTVRLSLWLPLPLPIHLLPSDHVGTVGRQPTDIVLHAAVSRQNRQKPHHHHHHRAAAKKADPARRFSLPCEWDAWFWCQQILSIYCPSGTRGGRLGPLVQTWLFLASLSPACIPTRVWTTFAGPASSWLRVAPVIGSRLRNSRSSLIIHCPRRARQARSPKTRGAGPPIWGIMLRYSIIYPG